MHMKKYELAMMKTYKKDNLVYRGRCGKGLPSLMEMELTFCLVGLCLEGLFLKHADTGYASGREHPEANSNGLGTWEYAGIL